MDSSPEPVKALAARVSELEAVMFDLDGTLVDTIALILASFRHATREVLGEAPPDDVLLRNVGIPLRAQMREFAPDHVDDLLAAYHAYNERVHDQMIAEYPKTAESLAEISESYLLGVVTSKSRIPAERGLGIYDLGRYFDVVLCADDVELHKPDPAPLLEAACRLGVDPRKCAYVGDSPHDMTAAIAADMVAIAALWGPFPERVLEPGPALALPSIAELPRLLSGALRAFEVC